jgi:hypothetical protein
VTHKKEPNGDLAYDEDCDECQKLDAHPYKGGDTMARQTFTVQTYENKKGTERVGVTMDRLAAEALADGRSAKALEAELRKAIREALRS